MTSISKKKQRPLCFIPIDDDLQTNPDDISEADLCSVCMRFKKSCAVIHGATGHMCVCTRCANTILKQKATPNCPICKQPIEMAVRIFT